MKYIFIFILFLQAANAGNKNISSKIGRGISSSEPSSIYSVSVQEEYLDIFVHQFELGAWIDDVHKNSAYSSYSIGLKLVKEDFYIEGMSGIGLISSRDVLLGGNFQFFHDVGLGFQNNAEFILGAGYKHVSSAGISYPNLGRDYIYFKMGVPFEILK